MGKNAYICRNDNLMRYYTIKIKDSTKKAKSIISFLKTLRDDYDFIEITEEESDLNAETIKELDVRYQSFKKNPTGKDWETLKKELSSK